MTAGEALRRKTNVFGGKNRKVWYAILRTKREVGDTVEILRIKYADTTLEESRFFPGGEKTKRIPIIFSVFLVKTREKIILVDAGCETMPSFEMENFRTPMEVLREYGIREEDVTDVIITHAHHDHTQCAKYFPGAMIHIQEDEYARGSRHLTENPRISTFREETTVEEGVRVVCIGGHTKGSCIVECSYGDDIFVLCGDECYSRRNLLERIPTGASVSPDHSRAFVEKYSAEPYICLLSHEYGEEERLPGSENRK